MDGCLPRCRYPTPDIPEQTMTAPTTNPPPAVRNAALAVWAILGLVVLRVILTFAMSDALLDAWVDSNESAKALPRAAAPGRGAAWRRAGRGARGRRGGRVRRGRLAAGGAGAGGGGGGGGR